MSGLSPFRPPALGVGVIYIPGIEPVLDSRNDLFQVIEVEPQTCWLPCIHEPNEFQFRADALSRLQSWPQAKLVHGVGFPVGGSVHPAASHVREMAKNILALQSPWCSEHLAFNQAKILNEEIFTGFFLPPLQTNEGIECAVECIRKVSSALPVPFAVETAVNYLKPQPWELADGEFVAGVCEASGCGILLDLHNLWANERNGRQPVLRFLDQLPLEHVWEIHLAGGEEMDGYWLDAHSGGVPKPLLDLAAEIIPDLPNLGAIIFELLPIYLPTLGVDGIEHEMECLRQLWEKRKRGSVSARVTCRDERPAGQRSNMNAPTPQEWENTLGTLVISQADATAFSGQLALDPGVALLRKLVNDVRAGVLAENYRLTIRLLLLSGGDDLMKAVFEEFWKLQHPRQWGYQEARAFGQYIAHSQLGVPHLEEVSNFELARLETMITGEPHSARFHTSPFALLSALGEGRWPQELLPQEINVEVTPE